MLFRKVWFLILGVLLVLFLTVSGSRISSLRHLITTRVIGLIRVCYLCVMGMLRLFKKTEWVDRFNSEGILVHQTRYNLIPLSWQM
ncbi:hypothetical protein BH18THE2_BH18THE2_28150 [soil metagenome]